MSLKKTEDGRLVNTPTSIIIKPAALFWTSLMFLYIYADYFRLITPGKLEHMINLQTPMGTTTPEILVTYSVILMIPALMIFLSIFIKPGINKWLNILVAALYACISILIIISQAWRWPRA